MQDEGTSNGPAVPETRVGAWRSVASRLFESGLGNHLGRWPRRNGPNDDQDLIVARSKVPPQLPTLLNSELTDYPGRNCGSERLASRLCDDDSRFLHVFAWVSMRFPINLPIPRSHTLPKDSCIGSLVGSSIDMEPWSDQRAPALAIVARGDQIETVGPARYRVRSQSLPDVAYEVEVVRERWTCSCAFHAETHRTCIHILAVRYRNGFHERAPPLRDPLCPRCHSGDVVANGRRHNKSGAVARYMCKPCGARFTGRDGFQKRRSDPGKIALALDLYFRGLSTRQVADHFRQAYGLRVSHMAVYRWLVHYSRLAASWLDAQGLAVGKRWHIDETVVFVNGEARYLWNVLDAETRMLLATHISRTRTMDDTRRPMKNAKRATHTRPDEILTDGMQAYPLAISKEFGKMGGPKGYTNPHRLVPSIRAKVSNNRIERLHGSEKDRIRPMRGFDTDGGAAALAEGFRVHYDAVRTHLALGTTPAEAAGLEPLDGFHWKAILERAVTRIVTVDAPSRRTTKSPD